MISDQNFQNTKQLKTKDESNSQKRSIKLQYQQFGENKPKDARNHQGGTVDKYYGMKHYNSKELNT